MIKKVWMVAMLTGAGVAQLHGQHTSRTVTINLDYDTRVPQIPVYRATRQASRIFTRAGAHVDFRNHQSQPADHTNALLLDLYIRMEAPADVSSGALGRCLPFRADGRIEVFYSRIQEYKPVECRDIVLAYILTHEITHVLEGMLHHSATGVMKEKWGRDDFKKIHAARLEFDPIDVDLIRCGIDRRIELSRLTRDTASSTIGAPLGIKRFDVTMGRQF